MPALHTVLVLAVLVFGAERPAFADTYINVDGTIITSGEYHTPPETCPLTYHGQSRFGGYYLGLYGGCVVNAGPMTVGTSPDIESVVTLENSGTHLFAANFEIVPSSRAKIIIADGATLTITGGYPLRIGMDNTVFIGGEDLSQPVPAGHLDVSEVMLDSGTLAFTQNDADYRFDAPISGAGVLSFLGSGSVTLSADNSGFSGLAVITNGGTVAVDGQLGGTFEIASGRLQGIGTVGPVFHRESGVIAPGNDAIGTLTITGRHHGDGGLLEIETALGDDSSPTDRLVVDGETIGRTDIRVLNAGGTGAQTVEGIKIIDVLGASNGIFSLRGDYIFEGEPAVVAGAYAYQLRQNGIADPADGDWYLRSTYIGPAARAVAAYRSRRSSEPMHIYQPGVPLYETHPQTLLALNELPSLRQRTGNRRWSAGEAGSHNGIWGRTEGHHYRGEAHVTTSVTDIAVDVGRLQIGADHLLADDGKGNVVTIGLTGQLGKASTDVRSLFGHGNIGSFAYGTGAALTFTSANGTYADLQAQVNRFSSDLVSDTLGALVTGNKGWGYALGAELGKQVPIGTDLALTPQIRLHYAHVGFDSFVDPRGAEVSSSDGSSLVGTAGLGVDQNLAWLDETGKLRRTNVYGAVNLNYEFLHGTSTTVSYTAVSHLDQKLAAGVGLGGSYHWDDDRFSIYGEVTGNTVLSNRAAYSLKGTAGLSVKF